ncbi:hypothetical protein [Streptomyces albiaxialis]
MNTSPSGPSSASGSSSASGPSSAWVTVVAYENLPGSPRPAAAVHA